MTDTDETFWNDPVRRTAPDVRTYLTLLRPYLLIITSLFAVSVLAGYLAGHFNPEIAEQMMGLLRGPDIWTAKDRSLSLRKLPSVHGVA